MTTLLTYILVRTLRAIEEYLDDVFHRPRAVPEKKQS